MPTSPEADFSTPLAEWTDPAPKSEGRDHLGMQAPSVALYAALVPGITNVTLRARYYSFYAWLAEQYAHRVGSTDKSVWVWFLRRAEALLALSSCAASSDGRCEGVGGVRWAERTWADRAGRATLDFGTPAEPGASPHYLDAREGAFGQAYWSSLRGLGILESVDAHDVPVPSSAWGERLAGGFASSVGAHGEQFLELVSRGYASAEELKEVGEALSPDAIPNPSVERTALVELLLGPDTSAVPSNARRESLELILLAARELKRRPDTDEVRWLLYAGQTPAGERVAVPPSLTTAREHWVAYHANELCHVAVEAFLAELLRILAEKTPTPVDEAVRQVVDLASAGWDGASTWKALRTSTSPPTNPASPEDAASERALSARVMRGLGGAGDRLTAAVRLLATLDARWSDPADAVARVFGSTTELGMRFKGTIVHVLRFFREREDGPIDQLMAEFVQRWVIERHLSVAMRKLRNQGKETFHFELLDGGLCRRRTTGPVFTNPRLSTALQFLQDVSLLDTDGPVAEHPETSEAA
jgi:hypothetical protein